MNDNKVEIESINIKTKHGSIKLTLEEARGIYDELHLLFGSSYREYVPYVPYYPYPQWTYTEGGDITNSAIQPDSLFCADCGTALGFN